MSEEEKQEKKFQVKDKRRFNEEGAQREEETVEKDLGKETAGAGTEKAASGEESARAGKEQEGEKAPKDGEKPSADLPEINFATFVVSLSSSVFIHLGLAPDPMTNETMRELPLAKQTIDILGMIQEKTRGNLTKEEGQLMESILYDLRMRYVEESKKG